MGGESTAFLSRPGGDDDEQARRSCRQQGGKRGAGERTRRPALPRATMLSRLCSRCWMLDAGWWW